MPIPATELPLQCPCGWEMKILAINVQMRPYREQEPSTFCFDCPKCGQHLHVQGHIVLGNDGPFVMAGSEVIH